EIRNNELEMLKAFREGEGVRLGLDQRKREETRWSVRYGKKSSEDKDEGQKGLKENQGKC
ncbi:MAG: hypothetical protein VX367_09455, partial [SAR324 cluster bacterium]|nr:hypothetical protein [SAR324 cluster bacterium]